MCNPWGRSLRRGLIGEAASGYSSRFVWLAHFAESSLPSFSLKLARDLHVAEPSTISANAIASDVGLSLTKQGVSGSVTVWHQRQSPARIWALGAATLVFGLAYAPNFRDLYSIWNADPNYSHGKLVIPIALFILWRRLSETPAEQPRRCAGTMVGLGLPDCGLGGACHCLRVELTVGGNRHPAARDCLSHLDFWRLAALAPSLAGHHIPCLFVSLAASRQRLDRAAAAAYRGNGQLLSASTFRALGDSRGKRYQPHDAPWSDAARRGPRLQWLEDADDHGRHDHGDDHPHSPADLEADHLACQYGAHRHAQQHASGSWPPAGAIT